MALVNKNFSIRPGATKVLKFKWSTVDPDTRVKTPVDLSSYAAKMQVRAEEGSTAVLMEFSTINGRITVNSNGEVVVLIVPAVSNSYSTPKGVYDLLLMSATNPSEITEFASGIVTLDRGVTI